MKILITGANGFLGTHLVLKLLDEGHTIYGLMRTPKKSTFTHPRLIIIEGDLNQSPLAWIDHLPLDLDQCIHTAGLVHAFEASLFFKVNGLGTKFLIEGLKKLYSHHPFKFILISSLAARGPAFDLGPVSDYGRSKKEAEIYLSSLAPQNWSTAIIRPPMVIGPLDPAFLDIFKMVKSGIVLLPGKPWGQKQYSFVCVFDLIQTIIKVMAAKNDLPIIYSAHQSIVTFEDIILEIKKQLNKKRIIFLPVPILMIKIIGKLLQFFYYFYKHHLRLTPDKAHELAAISWTCDSEYSICELKQNYQYDLPQTIAITLADYKKHYLIL